MRIIWVWVVWFILTFIISIGWYVSQPVVFAFTRGANSTVGTDANARNIITSIEYVSIVWGPFFVIFLTAWALVSSGRRDVESEIYS